MLPHLIEGHSRLKDTRQRGVQTPNHAATLRYLHGLEEEMQKIRTALDDAWLQLDDNRQFRKCSRHMDAAQQRMHRVIRKLAKRYS